MVTLSIRKAACVSVIKREEIISRRSQGGTRPRKEKCSPRDPIREHPRRVRKRLGEGGSCQVQRLRVVSKRERVTHARVGWNKRTTKPTKEKVWAESVPVHLELPGSFRHLDQPSCSSRVASSCRQTVASSPRQGRELLTRSRFALAFPFSELSRFAKMETHLCALYSSSSEMAFSEETLISSGLAAAEVEV